MKNFDNLTTTIIPNKMLLRLSIYISFTKYLEDEISCFTKIIKHNNISFHHEVVEDEDVKEDGKKAVAMPGLIVAKLRSFAALLQSCAIMLLLYLN